MIVIRLNTGNIKFRQRRPRKGFFCGLSKIYFTIKWKCRASWGTLGLSFRPPYVFLQLSQRWRLGASTRSMISTARWYTEWHWKAKENEQELLPAFFHQMEGCQNSKLEGCKGAGNIASGKWLYQGNSWAVRGGLPRTCFASKFALCFFPAIFRSLWQISPHNL